MQLFKKVFKSLFKFVLALSLTIVGFITDGLILLEHRLIVWRYRLSRKSLQSPISSRFKDIDKESMYKEYIRETIKEDEEEYMEWWNER
jgi:hypothetical protein